MRGLFLAVTPVPLRSTKSADIGQTIRSSARGEKITVDSCRRKDDVGATLVVAPLPDATNGATTRVAPTVAMLERAAGCPRSRVQLRQGARGRGLSKPGISA